MNFLRYGTQALFCFVFLCIFIFYSSEPKISIILIKLDFGRLGEFWTKKNFGKFPKDFFHFFFRRKNSWKKFSPDWKILSCKIFFLFTKLERSKKFLKNFFFKEFIKKSNKNLEVYFWVILAERKFFLVYFRYFFLFWAQQIRKTKCC